MSSTAVSAGSASDPQATPPRRLSPHEHEALLKGPKVDVVLGTGQSRRIVLEGAYANLLRHYSGLAKDALSATVKNFNIPEGHPKAIRWIYKYILGNEADTKYLNPAFDNLGLKLLAELHSDCVRLQYVSLATRAFNRMKTIIGKNGCRDHELFELILNVVPDLRHALIQSVAKDKLSANEHTYIEEVLKLDGIPEAIEAMVKEMEQNSTAQSSSRNRQANRSRKDGAEKAKQMSGIVCYNCGGMGHFARQCNKTRYVTATTPATTQGTVQHQQAARTGPKVTARPPPTCYKCQQVGHISRNCKARRNSDSGYDSGNSGGNNDKPVHRRGGKKSKHWVKKDRYIQVTGNGGGLTTCDYEVKKGQRTRLGLTI